MKKAIAMKCTREDWDSIKDRIPKEIIGCFTSFDREKYLANDLNKRGIIANIPKSKHNQSHYEFIETFNAKIFLEACGIEFEKKFEITKEQILKYNMKDEFPEVFKKELEVGKWYIRKHNNKCLVNFQGNESGYGFGTAGFWAEGWRLNNSNKENFTEATPQEVENALKNEWIKRGGKDNVYIKSTSSVIGYISSGVMVYSFGENKLYYGGYEIFDNGKFTQIIETISIQEAEKFLKEQGINKKIV